MIPAQIRTESTSQMGLLRLQVIGCEAELDKAVPCFSSPQQRGALPKNLPGEPGSGSLVVDKTPILIAEDDRMFRVLLQ
ncbi:MAG TPA: hypothetical protein VJP83_01325, partial [Terriglobales bacterium]|nr:hypothetical protein [Terriglobales bacterium]